MGELTERSSAHPVLGDGQVVAGEALEPEDRVWFYGRWTEFGKIVATNAILTLVTLGIYRFWGATRERRYLWSHTVLLGEELVWTGTGLELFKGSLIAIIVLAAPLFAWQAGFTYLLAHGRREEAYALAIMALLFINFVIGVAKFRGLRYRLSRTYWRGIRGGSNNSGLSYGLSNTWKWAANYLSAGLAIPWTMITLWNDRWKEMSFGQSDFISEARVGPVFRSFLLFYLVPIFLGLLSLATIVTKGGMIGGTFYFINAPLVVRAIIYLGTAFAFYWFIGIIFLNYYASFYREAVARLRLDGLGFTFEASAGEWMKLFLVDALLIVMTLGFGWLFLGYRHWAFFIQHLGAVGEIDPSSLHQSDRRQDGHGEGLLDALDIGAF